MYIHVLSPYRRQFAYPSFWKLLDKLSSTHAVYNPIEEVREGWLQRIYNSKLKHVLPLLFSLWNTYKMRKAPDAIITFGTYQLPFVFLLRLIFPRARLITYQPEMIEFESSLMTKAFRISAHRYNLFIDVDPMRLKLRKRYFKEMQKINTEVLPNFDHKVENKLAALRSQRVVFAGIIDSEASLVEMCNLFNIGTAEVDCYVTKYVDKQPPQIFNALQPRPFHQIAEHGYRYGLICYPFRKRCRASLNHKYCAPSKLFSYLSCGIHPVHYSHPTLSRFVKAGLSTDRPLNFDSPLVLREKEIHKLFKQMESQIFIATEKIDITISQALEAFRLESK